MRLLTCDPRYQCAFRSQRPPQLYFSLVDAPTLKLQLSDGSTDNTEVGCFMPIIDRFINLAEQGEGF